MNALSSLMGLTADPTTLTFLQISLRGTFVFIATLAMIRLGDKRFLSKKTAFDAVLGFILASMLARAVNGSSAFFPTLGGGFVLVLLHRLFAYLGRVSPAFGIIAKGRFAQVVKDGLIIDSVMRKNNLSRHDLLEDLRLNGNVDAPEQVKAAFLERNGQISVVRRPIR